MPRPVYIIASESYSEDSDSNILSLFRIVERVDGAIIANPRADTFTGAEGNLVMPAGITPGIPLVVVAVWMRSPNEPLEQVYEHKIALIRPDGTEKMMFEVAEAQFSSEKKQLLRFALRLERFLPTMSGVYKFEARLRKQNSNDEWLRQDYPIDCDVRTVVLDQAALSGAIAGSTPNTPAASP